MRGYVPGDDRGLDDLTVSVMHGRDGDRDLDSRHRPYDALSSVVVDPLSAEDVGEDVQFLARFVAGTVSSTGRPIASSAL